MKVLIIGMAPAIVRRVRLKGIPLAPMVLKSYADSRLKQEFTNGAEAEISLKTFHIEEKSPLDMLREIDCSYFDVIAMSVYIWNYSESMELARLIKKDFPSVKIICGGPQISPVAEQTMSKNESIDIIPYITVPGEIVFFNLIKTLIQCRPLEEVEGIVYRMASGGIKKTGVLSEMLDYASMPSPYLDGTFTLPSGRDYVVSLESSRGCPNDCGYCFWGRDTQRVHFLPIERVLNEIEIVYNHPDVKYVFWADADFFMDVNTTTPVS